MTIHTIIVVLRIAPSFMEADQFRHYMVVIFKTPVGLLSTTLIKPLRLCGLFIMGWEIMDARWLNQLSRKFVSLISPFR